MILSTVFVRLSVPKPLEIVVYVSRWLEPVSKIVYVKYYSDPVYICIMQYLCESVLFGSLEILALTAIP